MATLSKCLKIVNKIDDADANDVIDAVDSYIKQGIDPQEAQRMAAQDVLNNAHRDFNELDDMVRRQNPDAFDEPDILTQKSNEINSHLKDASLKDLEATDDEINELYNAYAEAEGGKDKPNASVKDDAEANQGVENDSGKPQQASSTQERAGDRPTGEGVNRQGNSEPVRSEPEPILREQSRADLEAKDKAAKAPESDKAVADREAEVPFTLGAKKDPKGEAKTDEMFTPEGDATVAAKGKAEKTGKSPEQKKFDAAQSKIDDMDLNPELTKPQVRNAAKKMLEDGVIDKGDYDNIDRILKDRDMMPEDALDDLKTSVEMNRPVEKKPKSAFGGGRMSSNPFFDPAMYREIGRDIAAGGKFALKAVSKVAEAVTNAFKFDPADASRFAKFSRELSSLLGEKQAERREAMGSVARVALRNTFEAYGARVNSVAKRSKSEIFKNIVKTIYTDAADTTGTDVGVESKMDLEFTSRTNKLNKMFDKIQDGIDSGEYKDADVWNQVANLVRNPSSINEARGYVHQVAAETVKTLKDFHAYLRESGVELGEIKDGYYPREFDMSKVMDKSVKFKEAVARAYRENGATLDDSNAMADDLYNTLTNPDNTLYSRGNEPRADFLHGRVFGKSVDAISHPLNEFLISDPRITMPNYAQRAVKRAELSRWMRDSANMIISAEKNPSPKLKRLIELSKNKENQKNGNNQNNWEIIQQKLEDDGVHPEARYEFDEYTKTVFGINSKGNNVAISWLRTYATSGMLERATFSSLGEIFMPAIRTGNALDIRHGMILSIQAIVNKNSKNIKELTEIGEDLGILSSTMNDTVMANRWGGGEGTEKAQTRNLSSFFKMTGLSHFTDGTRVASIKVGQVFARRMAKQLMDGGGKLPRNNLGELGIPPAKADVFAKWLLETNDGSPTASDIRNAPKEMKELYSRLLRKFDEQTIMRPNKSTKPAWAQDGIGSVIYQFQSYNSAFYEKVWKRNLRNAGKAVVHSGYTNMERAKMMTPLLMMSTLVGAQYYIGELRDSLFGDPDKKKSTDEKFWTAVSRGVPFAPLDPFLNIVNSARFNSTAAQVVSGASLSLITRTVDSANKAFGKNSEKTNTAERAVSKSLYDAVIEPAVSIVMSAGYAHAPTWGKVALAGGRQVLGSGKARDQFVNATAGKKDKKSSGSSSSTGGYKSPYASGGGGYKSPYAR